MEYDRSSCRLDRSMGPNKPNLKPRQNSTKRKVTMIKTPTQSETLYLKLPREIALAISNAVQRVNQQDQISQGGR